MNAEELRRRIRTLENMLDTMTKAEERAVQAYLPAWKDNAKLKAENSELRERNELLELVYEHMSEAARLVLECTDET